MTKSDQILWDALDRWGLPFRSTTSELIRLHGSKPSDWIEGYRICQVPTNSPLEDLFAAPLAIVIPPGMIRSHPPGNWRGSVRKYEIGRAHV